MRRRVRWWPLDAGVCPAPGEVGSMCSVAQRMSGDGELSLPRFVLSGGARGAHKGGAMLPLSGADRATLFHAGSCAPASGDGIARPLRQWLGLAAYPTETPGARVAGVRRSFLATLVYHRSRGAWTSAGFKRHSAAGYPRVESQ